MNHIHWYVIGTEQEKDRWRQAHPDQYMVPVSLGNPSDTLARLNPWDQVIYCDSYYDVIASEQRALIWGLVQRAKQRGRRVDQTASL